MFLIASFNIHGCSKIKWLGLPHFIAGYLKTLVNAGLNSVMFCVINNQQAFHLILTLYMINENLMRLKQIENCRR